MVDEIANIKKKFVFQFFCIKLLFYFDRSRKFCSEEEQNFIEQIRKWLQKKLRLRKVERFSVNWCVYVYVYVCTCVCVHVILVQECVLSFEVTFDILIDSFCILKDIWATEKGTLITFASNFLPGLESIFLLLFSN